MSPLPAYWKPRLTAVQLELSAPRGLRSDEEIPNRAIRLSWKASSHRDGEFDETK